MSERLLELLADRATEGLAPGDASELRDLLAAAPEAREDELDLAAAALDLALAPVAAEPLPAELGARVLADAGAHFAEKRVVRERRPGVRPGWWVAAAAVLLAALVWMTRPEGPPTESDLLAADGVRAGWQAQVEDYAAVEGEVVWSAARQRGLMKFRGLPANHPARGQYQLWIVDPSRDEHPVDGGVFDVSAGGEEVVVPFDAKLRVDDVRAFAVTLEKPGGVVVSDGPLLIVATLSR